jgi:hypothetical protein
MLREHLNTLILTSQHPHRLLPSATLKLTGTGIDPWRAKLKPVSRTVVCAPCSLNNQLIDTVTTKTILSQRLDNPYVEWSYRLSL